MQRQKLYSFILFLLVTFMLAMLFWEISTATAQVSETRVFIENFSNNSNPPQLNTAQFTHTFTISGVWALTEPGPTDPPPPSPPYALAMDAGNEDRVTFNLPSGSSGVTEASVWGYALVSATDNIFGQGQVAFEGTTDSRTFNFVGGVDDWEQFRVTATDLGDGGNPIGEIVAIQLIDVGNNGFPAMFDDLTITSTITSTVSNKSFLPFVIR